MGIGIRFGSNAAEVQNRINLEAEAIVDQHLHGMWKSVKMEAEGRMRMGRGACK